jgi:Protein of unknown function (DUF1064)
MNADRDAWTTYATRHGLIAADAEPEPARKAPPGNKYHAIPIHVDGVRFASIKESARYLELKLLEKAGAIQDLELHPVFPLHVFELYRSLAPIQITTIGRFTADFQYCDLSSGEIVVEDTKSDVTKTEAYRLRKRLAEVIHGIHVREL